ncbi:hypothetical protein [Lujinxingia vulgaris]|uniref:hypothetical protein n=1 Tax=Lujinxingia vulgaris TaxID=2600176 RepID=UPI001E2CCCF0|nr:hypothetical protein [Lujinxingia vulgaris]
MTGEDVVGSGGYFQWGGVVGTGTLAIAAGSVWGVSQMEPGVSKNDQQKFVRLVERWRDAGMDSRR